LSVEMLSPFVAMAPKPSNRQALMKVPRKTDSIGLAKSDAVILELQWSAATENDS
jgi:hypothetical protein